jgi:hypothetical protein
MPYRILCNGVKRENAKDTPGLAFGHFCYVALHKIRYGILTYQVWSSDQINWAAQENALFLEDYYQDLDRLTVKDQTLAILFRLVEEHPGIFLSELQSASEIPADLINIAIARHDLYVDLATYRLSEPWRTPVFRSQRLARARPKPQAKKEAVACSILTTTMMMSKCK